MTIWEEKGIVAVKLFSRNNHTDAEIFVLTFVDSIDAMSKINLCHEKCKQILTECTSASKKKS